MMSDTLTFANPQLLWLLAPVLLLAAWALAQHFATRKLLEQLLSAPMVARHLESDALRVVFAAVQPSTAQHFAARLDDPRRPLLEALAALLRDAPWTS